MSAAFERGWVIPEDMEKVSGMGYFPVYFSQEHIRVTHRRYGNARFYHIIDPSNGTVGTTYLLDDGTPHDEAMKSLRDDVIFGRVPLERHENAVKALMKGVFDWTPDSEYLPQIEGEQ